MSSDHPVQGDDQQPKDIWPRVKLARRSQALDQGVGGKTGEAGEELDGTMIRRFLCFLTGGHIFVREGGKTFCHFCGKVIR